MSAGLIPMTQGAAGSAAEVVKWVMNSFSRWFSEESRVAVVSFT